jgi:NAD(P)H-nitrite reductase large subunit
VGITNPEDTSDYEVLVERSPEKTVYKKILLKNGVIVGFIFLGDIEKSGILYHLLKNRVNVDGIKDQLLSEDFGLVSIPESVRKDLFVVN